MSTFLKNLKTMKRPDAALPLIIGLSFSIRFGGPSKNYFNFNHRKKMNYFSSSKLKNKIRRKVIQPGHQAGHGAQSGDARGESAKLAFGGLVKIVTRKGSHESGRDLEHIFQKRFERASGEGERLQ